MKILIVEDDSRIVSFLVKGLKAEGYAVSTASNGETALAIADYGSKEFDLVLLDLGLPGVDGRQVLQRFRARNPALPIIIVTARDELKERVWGLDAGAADYVTKPFAVEELFARIRAALRVHDQVAASELVVDDLRLDLLTKLAWRDGRRIDLTPREWALLEFLMRNPRAILSRTQILNHVWEFDYDPGSNVVDVYIGYLRRKLNRPGLRPLIQAVRGAGYRLEPVGKHLPQDG